MLTKTKLALAAALLAGTVSVAFAQDADSNPYNRYPAYNGPVAAEPGAFQSAPVALRHHNAAQTQQSFFGTTTQSEDRASRVIDGGGD